MLYSISKDSTVMLHLACKALYPARPPFPLVHIDSTWRFREMISFRNSVAREAVIELLVHTNPQGLAEGVNPFAHGSSYCADVMKTQALRQALDQHGFTAAFGGARRDEEKSRAKERIYSVRGPGRRWHPGAQRPELWSLPNVQLDGTSSLRIFPLSNWTEADV
jgi:sulfate adenylyltransferase subunit 2